MEAKTLAVKNVNELRTLKKKSRFSGSNILTLENISHIMWPLSDLLKEGNTFEFGTLEKQAFETVKENMLIP